MKGYKRAYIVSSLFIIIMLGTLARANTPDFTLFQSTYPTSNSFVNFNCAICHQNIALNTNLSPYGADYKARGRGLAASFIQLEGIDSDGDGFSNITEINAGSNPGSAASTINNVPPPPAPGGGSGGSVNSALSGSLLDSNNSNMLSTTGCGLVQREGQGHEGFPGEQDLLVLLLLITPLLLSSLLKLKTPPSISY